MNPEEILALLRLLARLSLGIERLEAENRQLKEASGGNDDQP